MPDTLRLAVLGASGRMGRAVVKAALEDSRFEIVSAHARAGSDGIGKDAATLAGCPPCGVSVSDDLVTVVDAADVVIDFTRPESTVDAASVCASARRALVSGTTGMDGAARAALAEAASRIPVFWAPNMSIG
ncbi:MAG TPA: 4-hydroxy-tetrahydrodipicolinate reductase, partial [Gammaproteobacteria bacterium]